MEVRNCARVVVVDPQRRVLLVSYRDPVPVDPKKPDLLSYWVPPGGAVHHGETFEHAAVRELQEETSILVSLGPLIWIRSRELLKHGKVVLQKEQYYVAVLRSSSAALAIDPNEPILACRWWSVPEILSSGETFLPPGLQDLIGPITGDVYPDIPTDLSCFDP